ncbi:RNA polymerase sigma factor [Membranihabitans maritimus]|uniref:RNA polymerase sigma factor n=1 Tax=Membranihabitans maritimus TaxID=2904244 RepID=UPI001F36DEA0|nr:RNA polymerase sigma factor [Membranihabitans maritimus]
MSRNDYNECVNEHSDNLFRYCFKLTQSRADADDLVQIAFVKLWENREKLEKVVAKSWLFRTAYNAMIDAFRKNKREREYRNVQEEKVVENQQSFENKDLIEQAFETLSEEQKKLILLRDYEGYSYNEIADISGLTLSNVKIILFRGRKILKIKLEELHLQEYNKKNVS